MIKPFLVAFALFAVPAGAASFDCARAHVPDERAICADRVLNDLDVRMAELLYVNSRTMLMGGNGAQRDEQRA